MSALHHVGMGMIVALTAFPVLACAQDRYQLFITGAGVSSGGTAYLFSSIKVDNVEAIAWDCLATVSTRRGDPMQANCKQANFQWAMRGNANIRSFMAYPFGENLKAAPPMAAMLQLDSASGKLQICVNNQYNTTASGCFIFTDN
jgi:hypothetical protein